MQSTSRDPRQDEIIYIQHPVSPYAPPVDREDVGDVDDSWSEGMDHDQHATAMEKVGQSQLQENRGLREPTIRRNWSDDGESSSPESETDDASTTVSAASSTSTDSSSDSSGQQIATATAHTMVQPTAVIMPSAPSGCVGACSSRPGIVLAVAASLMTITGAFMLGIGVSGSGLQQNDQSARDSARLFLQIFGGICTAVGVFSVAVLAEGEMRSRGCC